MRTKQQIEGYIECLKDIRSEINEFSDELTDRILLQQEMIKEIVRNIPTAM